MYESACSGHHVYHWQSLQSGNSTKTCIWNHFFFFIKKQTWILLFISFVVQSISTASRKGTCTHSLLNNVWPLNNVNLTLDKDTAARKRINKRITPHDWLDNNNWPKWWHLNSLSQFILLKFSCLQMGIRNESTQFRCMINIGRGPNSGCRWRVSFIVYFDKKRSSLTLSHFLLW